MNVRIRQLTALICFFAHLVTTSLAQAPQWWISRHVIGADKGSDDFAAMNQGQLKHLTAAACDEMNVVLPSGAGPAINDLVSRWRQNAGIDDFAVVTLGQLKATVLPFYQRLQALGVIAALPVWATNPTIQDNLAVANLGQAKALFSFDISSPLATSGTNDGTSVISSSTNTTNASGAQNGTLPTGAAGSQQGGTSGGGVAAASLPQVFKLATAVREKNASLTLITEAIEGAAPVDPGDNEGGNSNPNPPTRILVSTDPRVNGLRDSDGDKLLDDGLDADGNGDPDDPGDPRDLEPTKGNRPDDGEDSDGDGDPDDRDNPKDTQAYWDSHNYYPRQTATPSNYKYIIGGNLSSAGGLLSVGNPWLSNRSTIDAPGWSVGWGGINNTVQQFPFDAVSNTDNRLGWQRSTSVERFTATTKNAESNRTIIFDSADGSGEYTERTLAMTYEERQIMPYSLYPDTESSHDLNFIIIETTRNISDSKILERKVLGTVNFVIPQNSKLPNQATLTQVSGNDNFGEVELLQNAFMDQGRKIDFDNDLEDDPTKDTEGLSWGIGKCFTLRSKSMEYVNPGTEVVREMMPFSLSLDPSPNPDDTSPIVVSADDGATEIAAHLYIDSPDYSGATISWETLNGGSVSPPISVIQDDDWDVSTTLTLPTLNTITSVKATLTHLYYIDETDHNRVKSVHIPPLLAITGAATDKSANLVKGPGTAAVATLTPLNIRLPADGKTTQTFTAIVRDQYGNTVAQGTDVSWHLEGDGEILPNASRETDANGTVSVQVKAGRIAGAEQRLVLYADTMRQEFVIQNEGLGIKMTAGTINLVGGKQQFTVTATTTAANGTPVQWQTTRGRFISKNTSIATGEAKAIVQLDPTVKGEVGGLTIVTASVAKSIGMASVNFVKLDEVARQEDPTGTGNQQVTLKVSSLALAGRTVSVFAGPPLTTGDQTITAPASYPSFHSYVQHIDLPVHLDYDAEMTVEAAFPSGWNFSTGINREVPLASLSGLSLYLNAQGYPSIRGVAYKGPPADPMLYTAVPPISLGGNTRLIPGDAIKKFFKVNLIGRQVTLTSGNDSVTAPFPGTLTRWDNVPQTRGNNVGSVTWRPANVNIPYSQANSGPSVVTKATFKYQIADSYSVPIGLSGATGLGATAGQIALPAVATGTLEAGEAEFTLSIPATYKRTSVTVKVAPLPTVSGIAEAVVDIRIDNSQPLPNTLPVTLEGQLLSDLYCNAKYDNRANGPSDQEKAELRRFANLNGNTPLNALMAAPAASGGDAAHQAAQGKKLIELAKEINAFTAQIYETAKQLDKVVVHDARDAETKALTLFNIADYLQQGKQAVNGAISAKFDELKRDYGPALEQMALATVKDLSAMTRSIGDTDVWNDYMAICKKAGGGAFINDFEHFVNAMNEDGMAEMVIALAKFFTAGVNNPQALVALSSQRLDEILGPWLNQRATTKPAQVGAACVGLLMHMVQAGTMLAATNADADGIKRMLGQLVGTVMGAYAGNAAAKKELEEMVPFWSWVTMSDDVSATWLAGDYYGSGKAAANLLVQAIGDVTILVPVIKGVATAMKVGGAGARLSLKTMARQIKAVAGVVKRDKSVVSADADLTAAMRRCLNNGCFPAGTLVLMADRSLKPIQLIKPGDLVLADAPEDTEPPRPRRVADRSTHQTDFLVDVSLDTNGDNLPDATIRATREHPFWTQEDQWVFAVDLQPGYHCLTPEGQTATITSAIAREDDAMVYNLTVDGDHDFFVSQGHAAVLVHNENQVARHWIVYMIELETPQGQPKQFYVGRASKPADQKLKVKEVWSYRAGADGVRHHTWNGGEGRSGKVGETFLMPNTGSLKNPKIIASYYETNWIAGKNMCRAIEYDAYVKLKTTGNHDPGQNIPLNRLKEAQKNVLLATNQAHPARLKAEINVQRIVTRCP